MTRGARPRTIRDQGGALVGNSCGVLAGDKVDNKTINGVDKTMENAITSEVADGKRSLASAVAVVKAGSKVVLARDGSYMDNDETEARMKLREEGSKSVLELEHEGEEVGLKTSDIWAAV